MDISRCSASVARAPRRCWRTSTRSCARRALIRPTSTGSRSASAPGASPASASGSRSRVGSRSRWISPARAAGAPGALPVVDAKRREVFTLVDGEPRVLAPQELALGEGAVCVGDGARRYRGMLEARGAVVPPDDDERHLPRARFHAALAGDPGSVEELEPLYLRVPDAERNLG